jgi:hypothetical protein
MKKGILTLAVGTALIFASCASTNVQKSQMETGKEVRGSWTLSDVSYRGLADKEVQGNNYVTEKVSSVFDMAAPECYEGSTWNLVQNNKTGTYTFNTSDAGCPTGTAKIIWDIKEEGTTTYFTFKDITGIKAKQNTAGYRLRVDYLDANSMTLVQDVNASGKIVQVVYSFQR